MIMAGGTGGHVFPALALAARLRERACDVVWLGTRAGIEARLVPAAGIPVEWIGIGGLRGKGVMTLLRAPFVLLRALWQAIAAVRRQRPAVVVGLGGYVTGPGGLAAWLLRRPLVIHEQNAVAGLTNRVLARLAEPVLEAFPHSFPAARGARTIGNPVRAAFHALPSPEVRYGARSGALRLLVVGGSQGAAKLNATVPAALASLPPGLFEVRHQAGERGLAAAREAYARAGVAARIEPFIDDIAEAYAQADLVVCRAGALTVSELAAAGVAALFVPFAAAVDDHQTLNARQLETRGAARLLPEAELDAARLAQELRGLAALGRGGLAAMARAARGFDSPTATEDMAAAVLAAGRLA
jgi:UDP-N-acetylglucosamine--N-acetylmuramyl-(pentapeptide) pyrophosphoryl-undecaprenol N-acetylglucosamine transferase